MVPILTVLEYSRENDTSPFAEWFDRLDSVMAAVVSVAITRVSMGNISNVKTIGEGAAEIRIDRGPGYRIYFGRDGNRLVILPGGGTKRRQQDDIADALTRWRDYKLRKAMAGKDSELPNNR